MRKLQFHRPVSGFSDRVENRSEFPYQRFRTWRPRQLARQRPRKKTCGRLKNIRRRSAGVGGGGAGGGGGGDEEKRRGVEKSRLKKEIYERQAKVR